MRRLPSTPAQCFLRTAGLAGAIAAVMLLGTTRFMLDRRLVGLVLVAAWLKCELWLFRGNPPLAFYRQWCARRGQGSPTDAVTRVRPSWVLYASIGILTLCPLLPLASFMLTLAIAVGVWHFTRSFARPLRGVIEEYVQLVFIYVAYPDCRFNGPAGTGGMWIPKASMTKREWTLARMLAPLYAAIGLAVFNRTVGLGSGASLSIADILSLVLLLPLPHVLVGLVLIKPLDHLLMNLADSANIGLGEWEQSIDLVSHSHVVDDDMPLADHFFLGWYHPAHEAAEHPFKVVDRYDLPCRTPALVHESILNGHMHITGSTGTHKTGVAVIGLATQLTRGHAQLLRDQFGRPLVNGHGERVWGWSDPYPTLYIDLKGDLAFFNTVKLECERRGQRFHYFSLSKHLATCYFNPLTNLNIQGRPEIEFCEVALNAMSLYHGLSYGRSYYSKQSRDLLLATLKAQTKKPETWEELHAMVLAEIDPRQHKDVFELVSSIYALAQYPMLGPAPAGVDVIHMPSVIENREVCFCSLPARVTAISARDVAKLFLFSFVTAAAEWNDRNPERRCFVFLDEAQIICSSNLGTLFQQCSGAKTSMVLSNQAPSDLNVPDAPTLSDTVRVNTRLKQMFTVVDPRDAQDLIKASGERIASLGSVTHGTDGEGRSTSSVTRKQVLTSVLSQNDINALNNDSAGSLIHVTTGAGYTQHRGTPKRIYTPYPMSYPEYQRRMHTPWPSAPQPVSAGVTATTVVNTKDPEDVQEQAEQDYAKLMEFFRQTARRAGRDRMRDWDAGDDEE